MYLCGKNSIKNQMKKDLFKINELMLNAIRVCKSDKITEYNLFIEAHSRHTFACNVVALSHRNVENRQM